MYCGVLDSRLAGAPWNVWRLCRHHMVCGACLVLLWAACPGQSQGRQHAGCPGWDRPGES